MERQMNFNEIALNEAWSYVSEFFTMMMYLYLLLQFLRWLHKFQLKDAVFSVARKSSAVKKQIDKEFSKVQQEFRKDMNPSKRIDPITELPSEGFSSEEVMTMIAKQHQIDNKNWREQKVTGCVYIYDEELYDLTNKVCSMYNYTNPLHFDVFPSLAKFEAEIVSMVGNLFQSKVGCVTSGGTDSIVLSVKAHRQWALKEKGIHKPELILAESAHPAYLKACDILSIKPVLLPCDSNFQIVPRQVRKAVNKNTIMIIGSCPNYPYGTFDPLEELGKIAEEHNIGFHVDCCLGSFMLPFAKKLGYDIPNFDFSLPGVTSISVDTHKYGFSCKGTSVLLYREQSMRNQQYFHYPNWTGGLYTTGTIAGSRNGGVIAGTWAALVSIGEQGYMKQCGDIMTTANYIKQQITQIPELELMGDPLLTVIAFRSSRLNIYEVYEKLNHKGWHFGALQKPAGIHLTVTQCHVGHEQRLITDLKDVVTSLTNTSVSKEQFKVAPMYGTLALLPSKPVCEILELFNNTVFETLEEEDHQ